MHLLQRTAIHLIFFRPFPIHIFRCIFSLLLCSFFACAVYGPLAFIGLSHLSIHPSIHPAQFHRIGFVSPHCMSYLFSGFSSCFFIVYFLCFISSLRFPLFLPLYFRAVFRIFSRGFLVLYMAAVTHTTDLEREAGVESGRLDVPHSYLGFYLALALSLPF